MRILVLGANGMIGHMMYKVLSEYSDWLVIGSVRGKASVSKISGPILSGIDLTSSDQLLQLFLKAKPDIVINCAGLTKHLPEGNNPQSALTMNALMPHRLADYCALSQARLIHISTDCVFSGRAGKYREQDETDAIDVYGRSKAFGEIIGENSVTLRTSTIGHECSTNFGLLEWFLAQKNSSCRGYRNAIYSGLTTLEFARVVRDIVIPNPTLNGLYHVGASAIDKYSMLKLIAEAYKIEVNLISDESFCIDRSLNVDKFYAATGYRSPSWPELIETMYRDYFLGI